MADTKMPGEKARDDRILGDGLSLKSAVDSRRADGGLPSKALRHIVSDEQLEALKAHRGGIEQPLLWASLGVCAGSATGSISALGRFLAGGVLTMEGFVQNICFFSSLIAAVVLVVVTLPRRNDFARVVDQLRSRGES